MRLKLSGCSCITSLANAGNGCRVPDAVGSRELQSDGRACAGIRERELPDGLFLGIIPVMLTISE